ncbi:M23 family metallopeptidase [Microbacterium sp. RG1]|uniref:M23 family metallopeptidase n=1 Tax=Microbacterium sp. RG1 TaxID=2489212 RepID=UPI0010CA3D9B|nr:M23 family metallopeptidase [Microbacterium sp. RG1]QCQ16982.1 hypothetical protein EHF32_09770 [Microbacterium sp. RG1]
MGILRDYYSGGYTSPYGDPRPGGRTHRGQDISHSTQPGTIGVPALRAGTVVGKTAPSSAHGFGHGITVRSVLDDGNEWDISYSHGPWASSQQVGERVAAGQVILHEGTSGSTDGSCVHIEQRRVSSGAFTDPLPEIKRIAARDNGAEGAPPAVAPSIFKATAKANSNGRREPNTSSPVVDILRAGTEGTFKARAAGQVVEGKGTWFQGYYSGLWYWEGAF